MTTSTPNTLEELITMNTQEEETEVTTQDTMMDLFLSLSYEEQDNFIYHLLKGQLKFHNYL